MSTINMTNTDPGEGSALPADTYLAVYGGTSLLDLFYPVGMYIETSDVNFDPNVSWGGVWVEDTAGRTTVAYDSSQTEFDTIGETGGNKKHRHDFKIGFHRYFGAMVGDNFSDSCGAWADSTGKYSKATSLEGAQATHRNNAMVGAMTLYNETTVTSTGDTMQGSSLQPYIVVKRWHRTA